MSVPPSSTQFATSSSTSAGIVPMSAMAITEAAIVPGGAVMHWHVDDLNATVGRLLSMGAKEYDPITPRGETGFVTASVVDPFGNVLGVMYNPHYLEVLASTKPA